MWTRALADSDESCGGKAGHIARLIAAGLPVPDGFVITDRAFRTLAGTHDAAATIDDVGHALAASAERIASAEVPAELVEEVAARVAALGMARLAVRSSAAIEDGARAAAARSSSTRTRLPPRHMRGGASASPRSP